MPTVLVRPIWSKRAKIHWPSVKKELEKWLDEEVKPDLLNYFNKIVADWKHKPDFKAKRVVKPNRFVVYVWPVGEDAKVWKFVSGGTKPHDIVPVRAKALRFKWDGPGSYKPRTGLGGQYKGPGIATGEYVFRQVVHQPGNKPRNLEKHIARWYKQTKRYPRGAKNAIERGIYRGRKAAR